MFLLLQLLSAICRFNWAPASQFHNSPVLFSEYRPIWLSFATFYICCFVGIFRSKLPILIGPFCLFVKFLSGSAIFNVQLEASKLGVASPTQDTWRSNDYVSMVRLVECKMVVFIL